MSRRRITHRSSNSWFTILVVCIAMVSVFWWGGTGREDGESTSAVAAEAFAATSDLVLYPDDMIIGKPDAPLTVIEYASLTCPHCANFHEQHLPVIRAKYIDTGKVRLVYRNFFWDKAALDAATLATCAGPEKYFAFISVLFQQQNTWAKSKDHLLELKKIGKFGGVSESQFDSCLKDSKIIDTLLERRKEGTEKYQVDSTPTFILNGKKLDSHGMTPEEFASFVDPLLK